MSINQVFKKMHSCNKCHIWAMEVNQRDVSKGYGKLEAWGNRKGKNKVMFIAQNPSVHRFKDLKTPADAGISKELVDTLIALGMSADDIYFTNLVKCSTQSNRPPYLEEIDNCSALLLKEIELMQPRLIVAVGRIAYDALMPMDLKIPVAHITHPSGVKRSGKYEDYAMQLLAIVELSRAKFASKTKA